MGKAIIVLFILLLSGCATYNQMAQPGHEAADHHQVDFARHFEGPSLLFTEKGLFGDGDGYSE